MLLRKLFLTLVDTDNAQQNEENNLDTGFAFYYIYIIFLSIYNFYTTYTNN